MILQTKTENNMQSKNFSAKYIKIIVLVVFIICTINISFSQKVDSSYNYPVNPKSDKWKSFTSVKEMHSACEIPENIKTNLTTKGLLQSCINYPAIAILLIHNSPQDGFNDWMNNFNGIRELLNRKDAFDQLVSAYISFDTKAHINYESDIDKGRYIFILKIIESIIVQDEIINNLDFKQQKLLLKSCLNKYNEIEKDEIYGLNSLASTGRIISKLSVNLGDQDLKSRVQKNDVQKYIKSGLLDDNKILFDIVSMAKKIDTNE
jgi:hypothetical protein